MNLTNTFESNLAIDDLIDHIHGKTFGRLHDLCVNRSSDGRVSISATAHSRFVGQLAEWAVLERLSASDVHLSISVCTPTRHYREIPK